MLNKSKSENTSTPKRRRLGTGTGRTLRTSLDVLRKNFSPVSVHLKNSLDSSIERCESPPIPCNQNEYLSDSSNYNHTSSLRTPQSPCVFESSITFDENLQPASKNVTSKFINVTQGSKILDTAKQIQEEIENISDDFFHSKLEIQESFCDNYVKPMPSSCVKMYRQEVEESFNAINQSICGLEINQIEEKYDLFETQDSFLLDVNDTGAIIKDNNNMKNGKNMNEANSFYGLPLITKSLFKSLRNIEKFYDWQEECLNLDAIRNRNNLIYALPTSGGKTLVAEVLMMREVLNRKHNALFVLPFVAIVQEKICSLSPFAVKLDFLVEEYAAGKGHIPPIKRRRKNSIYIATIEKALALVRSLIELDRLNEIGLIVVDELHLIGEPGRGSTLETLLTTVKFANRAVQIVSMSATIGNLPELGGFLSAQVYQRDFRPVRLTEYVKLGDSLHRLHWGAPTHSAHSTHPTEQLRLELDREIKFDYSAAATSLDPDWLGGLVSEVTPADSCLVFCPTKRNCENVAALLYKMQRREMINHRVSERVSLSAELRAEGASEGLARAVTRGIAFHHAGLANDERTALEAAFRSGVISVLCCTSTLAAGVNLPARRVIIRAPLVGRALISLAAYRQMAGRAGRAGYADTGECILMCSEAQWSELRELFDRGVAPALSSLHSGAGGAAGAPGGAAGDPGGAAGAPGVATGGMGGAQELTLSAVALGLAPSRRALDKLYNCTLLAVQADRLEIDVNEVCSSSISALVSAGALRATTDSTEQHDTILHVTELGNAAVKGCLDLNSTRQLMQDVAAAARGTVLSGSLHLLYLVTPHNATAILRPDYRHYYTLYCNLNEEGVCTANMLGITEKSAIRMITGKSITNVSETVLTRFYLALMLNDLYNQVELIKVVEKYSVGRGVVQQVMTSCCSRAMAAGRVCAQLPALWQYAALFSELAPRLQHAATPELRDLCQLTAVKKSRALQLYRAGYKRVEQLARASPEQLSAAALRLSRAAAAQLIASARLMLIEKVENLRAEAENVMEDLKI